MSDNLDTVNESLQETITRGQVVERVENWKSRLNLLFSDVRVWAEANTWRVDASASVSMHEPMMRQFDVPPTTQPVLRLDGDRGYALFKPKGLWVIGANGRIDLYTSKGAYTILDLAEYGQAPRWTIFRTTQKPAGEAFMAELLSDLV